MLTATVSDEKKLRHWKSVVTRVSLITITIARVVLPEKSVGEGKLTEDFSQFEIAVSPMRKAFTVQWYCFILITAGFLLSARFQASVTGVSPENHTFRLPRWIAPRIVIVSETTRDSSGLTGWLPRRVLRGVFRFNLYVQLSHKLV